MMVPLKVGLGGWPAVEASTGYRWMAPAAQPPIAIATEARSNLSVMLCLPDGRYLVFHRAARDRG